MPVLLPTLRLREHREHLGLTQAELAERLVQMAWARERIHVGVNGDMVSKWERGLKQPSKLYRRLLCLTMDAGPHELGLLLNADDPANMSAAGAVIAPGLLPLSAPHFLPGAVNADLLAQVDQLHISTGSGAAPIPALGSAAVADHLQSVTGANCCFRRPGAGSAPLETSFAVE